MKRTRAPYRGSPHYIWTHPSVLQLLDETGHESPIEAITERARALVLGALDSGWTGPPYDPLELADYLGLEVAPAADVADARVVPRVDGTLKIEFNPNRAPGRVRYSLAHELAHTLFSDCAAAVRNRLQREHIHNDDWELESLCNVAAAELLMPYGSLPCLTSDELSLEHLLELRQKFDVSAEALLLHAARLSDAPVAVFCASRSTSTQTGQGFRIDYAVPSRSWRASTADLVPPANTALAGCAAIGFTANGREVWSKRAGRLHVEAIAIPPYPGSRFPRVVGTLRPEGELAPADPCFSIVKGDATEPRTRPAWIVQLVNNKTPNWGGAGFATAVARRWPAAQRDFRDWAQSTPGALSLGRTRIVHLEGGVSVASLIAQKGYGPSTTPRIRYAALREGLTTIAMAAKREKASLHMPRLGAGQAGGSWPVIEDIIRTTCCDLGVQVTVYDLPGTASQPTPSQMRLPL